MQRKRGIRFCGTCNLREGEKMMVPPRFADTIFDAIQGSSMEGLRHMRGIDTNATTLEHWKLIGGRCPVCFCDRQLAEAPECTGEPMGPDDDTRCVQATGLHTEWCEPCRDAVDKKLVVATSRRSGRTLSALAKAISLAESGKRVTYVVHQISHANYCINLLREHGLVGARKAMTNGQFKFNTGGSLAFIAHTRSTPPPEETDRYVRLFDHYVSEPRGEENA